jgi:hypothetical protein
MGWLISAVINRAGGQVYGSISRNARCSSRCSRRNSRSKRASRSNVGATIELSHAERLNRWQQFGNSRIVRCIRETTQNGRSGRQRTHLEAGGTVQVRVRGTGWRFESSHPHQDRAVSANRSLRRDHRRQERKVRLGCDLDLRRRRHTSLITRRLIGRALVACVRRRRADRGRRAARTRESPPQGREGLCRPTPEPRDAPMRERSDSHRSGHASAPAGRHRDR